MTEQNCPGPCTGTPCPQSARKATGCQRCHHCRADRAYRLREAAKPRCEAENCARFALYPDLAGESPRKRWCGPHTERCEWTGCDVRAVSMKPDGSTFCRYHGWKAAELWRRQNREQGLCGCGEPPTVGYVTCAVCRAIHAGRARRFWPPHPPKLST